MLSMFSAGAVYRAHPGCKVAEEEPYWLGRGGLMLYPFSFQALLPSQHHHCFQRCCHNASMLGVLLPWVAVVTFRMWTCILLPTLERDTRQLGEASHSHSAKAGFSGIQHPGWQWGQFFVWQGQAKSALVTANVQTLSLQAFAACRKCPSSCISLIKSWEQRALRWGSWVWPGRPLTS